MGLIEQLPKGARVDGFNDGRVKLQCNDRYYFVLVKDVEGPDSEYHLD